MSDATSTELVERVFVRGIRKLRRLILASFAVVALMPTAVFSHHSAAPYDSTREVVFEGTVTELEWKNPHVLMTIETRADGGSLVLQEIEASALSQVRTWGLPREAIAPGQTVVVRAWPNRSGPRARVLGIDIKTSDGRVYALNLQAAGSFRLSSAAPATGLAGRWVPTAESWNEALSWAGSDFPFTEAGRTARAELARTLATRGTTRTEFCEQRPSLPVMLLPELRTIEVGESSIVMSLEAEGVHQQRMVHMDGTAHPAGLTPSLLGHSIGRWESDTLVIDTVGIAPHIIGSFAVASTASTHLIERLRLTADRRQLEYTFTVEDPAHLTSPISYTALWDHRPDLEPSLEVCDPENARRALVQ